MRIAVYTIAKNESENLREWYDSCRDADCVLLCDTGSEDHTVLIAEALKIPVVRFTDPFSFDKAKNFALQQLPEDIDLCISLDCDERLMPNWRALIESSNIQPDATCLVTVIEEHKEAALTVGRIHGRNGFQWRNPIHEYIAHESGQTQSLPEFGIYHKQDQNKNRNYLPQILEAIKIDPENWRLMYNLAMDLAIEHDRPEDAVLWLRRALDIVGLDDVEFVTHLYRLLGEFDVDHAAYWLHKACELAPFIRENWFALSGFYYERDWEWCLYASKKAINIAKPTKSYLDGFAWGAEPYRRAAESAFHLGDMSECSRYYTLAIYTEPDNQALREAKNERTKDQVHSSET